MAALLDCAIVHANCMLYACSGRSGIYEICSAFKCITTFGGVD